MPGTDEDTYAESATLVVSRCDISPEGPVSLGGFASRCPGDLAHDRETPLEANGLLLRYGGRATVLITLDSLYPADLEARVRAALRDGDPDSDAQLDDLIFAASHTHFAPMIDAAKPGLGALDATYRDVLVGRVAIMIAAMLDQPGQPGYFRSAVVDADHAINRRRKTAAAGGGWDVSRGPNPAGVVDTALTLGVFEDSQGRELAVIWSYACHPVCSPRIDRVSADFPGHVRQALRQNADADLPVLYLQGFSGDARPRPFNRDKRLQRLSRNLGGFPTFTDLGWTEWTDRVCASACAGRTAARLAARLPLDPAILSLSEPLGAFVSGAEAGAVGVVGLRLTTADLVVGVSAEASGQLGVDLRAETPDLRLFLGGCVGDTFGYLATADQMREGGYEGGGFLAAFSLSGAMRPDGVSRFRAMATRAIAVLANPAPELSVKDRLARDIAALGLRPGDTVLARASMRTVDTDSDTLIDAVMDVIGPQGTLAILAFTPIHPLKTLEPGHVFTPQTPPTTGGFAFRLMQRPGAVRSRHPTNSWVALGPRAEFLLASHGPEEPAFDPIQRLMEADGKFAVFGCVDTCPGFSTIHYIERLQGQSNASPVSGRRGVHYLEDGQRKTFVRRDVPGCSRGYWHFYKDYFDAGVLADGFVGSGYSYLMSAVDAYTVEAGILNQDPGYAICADCTCPKREVVRSAALRSAPAFEPAILRTPDLHYDALTFAEMIDRLEPAFAVLRARPPLSAPSSGPPESLEDCARAALRFVSGGCDDIDALLDARIAVSEYARPFHLDLLIWMLNAASGALPAGSLSMIASGLPFAALARLDRCGEIDWLVAYNRLRKLARDGTGGTKARDAYKTFMRGNLAGLKDGPTWRGALSAYQATGRGRPG